jgi:hypothetical protein
MNSVDAVQYFITSGKYLEMVEIKRKLEIIKGQLKQYQLEYDLKEMTWIKEGVIGYFESVRVFDRQGGSG